MSGLVSHLSGIAAEQAVALHYQRKGDAIAATRLRNAGGEIDLVVRSGDEVVFVEVKRGRTHLQAAERLGRRQIERLFHAAQLFLEGEPRGQLTPIRFDLALVDAVGRIDVIENALTT